MFAIIGGGIGGLTTALAFEKLGIDYQVFEKTPEITDVGAGILLAPNALQVFEWLNILEEVKASGSLIKRITLGKSDFSPLFDDVQDHVKEKFGYHTVSIHRAELQKLLVKKIPQQKLHLGKSFDTFEEINDKVKILFNDDSEFEADFLIGADGINSKIRKQLFPGSKIRYSGQTCWRGIANYKLDDDFEHRGIEVWSDQVRFGIAKVAKDKIYWFAVFLSKPNQKDYIGDTKKTLLKKYQDFHPLINKLISCTQESDIIRNDIIDLKPLKQWYKNNVCLIGDAGHATTPNMGQGGAQAIEDAYYLANLINENPNKNVFQLFQQKRVRRVQSIVKQSWVTGKIAHWKYLGGFRNYLIKCIPHSILREKIIKVYELEESFNS
ncbi:zeaxanthin epoxidase [Flavobacteriaceae bacterium R38]|nr:zeaxanthin epoxidase [Flavobacteriaceae bacterium R38]